MNNPETDRSQFFAVHLHMRREKLGLEFLEQFRVGSSPHA
jgi:hypothetical protein